jgi:AraC-like DNA-binding protein
MIKFVISLYWEGKTTYASSVPRHLQHLALPGLKYRCASGPWGYIFTQRIEGPFFMYGIHHFDVYISNTVYPVVPKQTFILHKLIQGYINAEIDGGLPVQLSPDWSQFFVLPANKRQQAFLPPGKSTAQHFDFRADYLQARLEQYPQLREVIDAAIQEPKQAYHASTLVHTDFYKREWARLSEQLKKEQHPVLYLEYQALRFLKEHCEGLERNDVDQLYALMKGEVSHKELEAVYQIKKHIDANLKAPHTHASLAKAGSTNQFVLRTAFKKVYEEAPYKYIMRMRMELGYYLVTQTADTIETIAGECGYNTASHFGKKFKEAFGVTPGSLRI